jgi:nucleotide-binding universal stress UspA family protein
MSSSKIVVGVDGSENAERAVKWCAEHAAALDAEVVAVYVVDLGADCAVVIPPIPAEERDEMRNRVARDWCKALADAGVAYRAELTDGNPARALMKVARREDANLIVTGRRGGGFAKLILGSTTDQLAHHLDRVLVIIP